MLNPSLKDLNLASLKLKEIPKLIAKERSIKGYESMSEGELLGALKASELLEESRKNFDDTEAQINIFKARIKKIREKLKGSRHKFPKSGINEIKKNLHEIENNLSASRIKEIYLICQLIKIIINQ